MCIWKWKPKRENVVAKERPKTVYKVLGYSDRSSWYEKPRWRFYSMHGNRSWRKNTATMNASEDALDWKYPRLGVFAFVTKKDAEWYRDHYLRGRGFIVRCEVWGRVAHHGAEVRDNPYRGLIGEPDKWYTPRGLRAERARVVEVWLQQKQLWTNSPLEVLDYYAKQIHEVYPHVLVNVSGKRVRFEEVA